jgi:pyruvate dehydrogenase E2 component (dihydrolipoamide acetyltransferase)
MPALEMAQETGKLVSWLKKEGEQVKKGDMLIEVETDKAVVEIEAQSDGILGGVTAKTGDVVPVGQTIAWLLKPGESVPQVGTPTQTGRTGAAAAPAVAAAASASASAPDGASAGPAPAEPGSAAGARISPKARKLAREHGLDIATIKGSGPGGEILADDILKASVAKVGVPDAEVRSASPSLAPSTGPADAVSSIGRIMAERTTTSWTTVPHFFVSREVDVSAMKSARDTLVPKIEELHGVKMTHTDLLVAAVARALRKHPRMNASWDNGRITLHQDVNVGLAIAVENAVVAAVVHKADQASIGEIAKQRIDKASKARANKLSPADIAGATFTISNLGMFNVDAFTAIIVPPQVGILAVGAMVDRVVAVDGMLAVRPMMTITLSSDHRVVDGASAARFLNDVVVALGEAGKFS